MREKFEESLYELFDSLVQMSSKVDIAISQSITALMTKDANLAKEVMEGDSDINSYERKIEAQCMRIIMKHQPVASDLRLITSAMKMVTDLERIGDQAADISELVLTMLKDGIDYNENDLGSIAEMAELAKEMVQKSIQGFVDSDLDYSYEAISRDEQVDEYYLKVRDEVTQDIKEEIQELVT